MWVEAFLRYLKNERNYSDKTVKEYGKDLRAFEFFFKREDAVLSWSSVDADVVRNWMVRMMDGGDKATTVNRRLSALRTFYRYLLEQGLVSKDPVRLLQGPKKKKPLPVFVKESEMNRLLDGDFFEDSFEGRRNRLIVSVFYETGIRLSELTGLNEEDIDLECGSLKVTGKRNKQRIVPFGKELRLMFRNYIEEKNAMGMRGAMFVDVRGERLSNEKVRNIVRHYLGMVTTQRKRSPHVLRHTFATTMLNHHAHLESVKELLGHESISTTEIYTHTTFEELKEMYNQAHPRA